MFNSPLSNKFDQIMPLGPKVASSWDSYVLHRKMGGGGVEARRPENSLGNVFLVINLFYSLQSGSNGFITEGRRGSNFFQGVGVSKETHITCDFQGGVRTPNPPLDPHVGSPDATVCLQNHGLSKFK